MRIATALYESYLPAAPHFRSSLRFLSGPRIVDGNKKEEKEQDMHSFECGICVVEQ
jgi:hypothetical protein